MSKLVGVAKELFPDKYEINKSTKSWIEYCEKKIINNNNKKCHRVQ